MLADKFVGLHLCLCNDLLSLRRDRDIARPAFENRDAELFFELLDGNGKRRLTNKAGFGSSAEVPFTRNGDDVFKFGKCHDAC